MEYAYASRHGHVKKIIEQLELDATRIESGQEKMDKPFILFTYTDKKGETPEKVEQFLKENHGNLAGVIVSGDKSHKEDFAKAGDNIAKKYGVKCLYKVEGSGSPQDIAQIKQILAEQK
jgi:protein involved in ribonucleotide reduction